MRKRHRDRQKEEREGDIWRENPGRDERNRDGEITRESMMKEENEHEQRQTDTEERDGEERKRNEESRKTLIYSQTDKDPPVMQRCTPGCVSTL